MDDLEDRLTGDLRAAAEPIRAGDRLGPAVRTAVRRRRLRTAVGAAVAVVVLLAGAAWLIDSQTDDASDIDTVVAPDEPAPAPEPEPGPPIAPEPLTDPLRAALEELGAAVDTAPDGVTDLGGAQWCGAVVQGQMFEPNEPAACLFHAVEDATGEAVMVRSIPTVEGDPIIEVIRASAVGATDATIWSDPSQDELGAPGWWEMTCDLTFEVGPEPIETSTLGYGDCRQVGAPAASLAAPGSATFTLEFDWPLSGVDRADVFLVEQHDGPFPRWAWAGTAHVDGRVELVLPARFGVLHDGEFGDMAIEPTSPGTYDLVIGRFGDVVTTVEITEVDESPEEEPDAPAVDPTLAVLDDTGIWLIAFGAPFDDAIGALEPILGPSTGRIAFAGCATSSYAVFESGVLIEFWPGAAEGTEEFVAWYYGGTNPFTGEPLGGGGDFTTDDGIGLGSTRDDVAAVGGGFSGGYDSGWGADIWFTSDHVAGSLTSDATNPSATVASITGGRQGAPARMVC